MFGAGYFNFSRAQSGREWLIKGEITTARRDAVEESLFELEAARKGKALERSSQVGRFNLFISYESKTGNVFTPENLRIMHEVESIVTGYPTREDYCLLSYTNGSESTGCFPAFSPAGAVFHGNGSLMADWQGIVRDLSTKDQQYGYFFTKDFDAENVRATYTRSIVYVVSTLSPPLPHSHIPSFDE